ncbi:TIGR01458 family HAD-type hydrolase [Mixta theicola]|uniref:TIGR01458 family HAD-type hydrolase n=1 Tax=Mixta theicola TaxID=1458355 RepID=A0A2K1Q6M2_9GAMM|nr:HAD-IIA family hydrolase [Mixta theicola]PNS10689.1 TIGR01458 family HAD-type hydrolase [Mixta theicola]GLR10921.1 haloacid dehalogenase [Mixta theicola]
MMKPYTLPKGFIFDIDGTLILHGNALPGAVATVNRLKEAGFALRFVSNTTSRSAAQLAESLNRLGFTIAENEIQTSVTACLHYLSVHYPTAQGYLAVPENIRGLFSFVSINEDKPEFVIMGDLDNDFNYALLNKVFNFIRNGAQLIVFHRNPWYFSEGKTWLDSGAFTLALESATERRAVVTGKPSPVLFNSAIASMKLDSKQVVVIGDDVSTDIAGARNIGLNAMLVGSGKFKPDDLIKYDISEAHFLPQLADLLTLLNLKA